MARAHGESAFGLSRELFTNYSSGFVGTLDYVLGDRERLRAVQRMRGPGEAEMGGTYIPSRTTPSDHIPVVCDVRALSEEEGHGEHAAGAGGEEEEEENWYLL